MEIGMVGLGRMGAGMSERLRGAGHMVVGYDRDPALSDVGSLEELVRRLAPPRVMWVMVPAGPATEQTLEVLAGLLSPGDVAVDGGNSRFSDSIRNGERLRDAGVGFLDVGVSGGVWGADGGYALMVGGAPEDVERVAPVLTALKPAGEGGLVHAGPSGAGHFAKMVHNGIEYGLMEAYAEGYELLASCELEIDVPAIIESWRSGSVIRSWLLDLLARALDADDDLSELRGYVQDSGEGRWTVQSAIDLAVPVPVIASSLFARFSSRQDDSPAMKVVAALRNQFGGHAVTAKPAPGTGAPGTGADAPGADVTPPPVDR